MPLVIILTLVAFWVCTAIDIFSDENKKNRSAKNGFFKSCGCMFSIVLTTLSCIM